MSRKLRRGDGIVSPQKREGRKQQAEQYDGAPKPKVTHSLRIAREHGCTTSILLPSVGAQRRGTHPDRQLDLVVRPFASRWHGRVVVAVLFDERIQRAEQITPLVH